MWFLESAERERQEQTLELPVVGAYHAPSLMRFFEQQGARGIAKQVGNAAIAQRLQHRFIVVNHQNLVALKVQHAH